MITVRELSPQEEEDLRVFMRATRDVRLLKRAQIVWMSHRGKTVPEIARDLDMDEDTVRTWIRRYEHDGLDGLRDKPRPGRPATVTSLFVETLLDWVPKSPVLAGKASYTWTLGMLRDHLEEITGIRVSVERVRQILLVHGIRFTRPKLHLESPDPDYDAKVEAIRNAVTRAAQQPETVILFEDEADFHLNPFVRPCWQDERRRVRAAGINEKRFVFGAVDLEEKGVHQRVCKRKRAREFIAFLRQLRTAYPGRRLLVVLDNFGIHKTRKVDRFLDEDGGIELLFLPTYSPQLNPIEPFWKHEKNRVLANVFHGTAPAMYDAVRWWYKRYRRGTTQPFRFKLPEKFQGLS